MRCIDRYDELKDQDFDQLILKIRNGSIKCGRYSHLVKVDKKTTKLGKELFSNDHQSKSGQ